MTTTLDDILDRISPEFRHTVKQAAWVFLSEGIKPSTVSVSGDTVLCWFIEDMADLLGVDLIRAIGIQHLWAYCYHYLEQNIGFTVKGDRRYIAVRPNRYKQTRKYTRGYRSNMFDIERALGSRPSNLVKYDAEDLSGHLN